MKEKFASITFILAFLAFLIFGCAVDSENYVLVMIMCGISLLWMVAVSRALPESWK